MKDAMKKWRTGYVDCNGKVIREGDVMRTPLGGATVRYERGVFTISTPTNRIRNNRAVENWRKSGNEFMASAVESHASTVEANTHLEVIGSVYENPELVETPDRKTLEKDVDMSMEHLFKKNKGKKNAIFWSLLVLMSLLVVGAFIVSSL